MNQILRIPGLVWRTIAILVTLALLRGVIAADRSGQPAWPRLQGGRLRQIGDSVSDAMAMVKQRIIGGWTFLAQRDTSGEQEWMDLPGQDPVLLADMFSDLRRVNRWLGGGWTTSRGLASVFRHHPAGEQMTILDVASGSVDIPRIMTRWARRNHRSVSIIATDINAEVLKIARDTGSAEAVRLVTADALHLPFADDAVDVVACSFFLHHLDRPDVIDALREMRRVSRGRVLINDMVRSWPSFLGAWLFSRIFSRNPISRHDAPLSARRSYTRDEIIEMAGIAGLTLDAAYGFFGYRVMLVTSDVPPTSQSVSLRSDLLPATAS